MWLEFTNGFQTKDIPHQLLCLTVSTTTCPGEWHFIRFISASKPPECNKKTRNNWLTIRVLDLDLASVLQLGLHPTTQDSPQSPYMTLSHCWGKYQIKKLGAADLHLMCEKIDS